MVSVGFFSVAVGKADPSTTKTFLTSCIWLNAVSAERFGSVTHPAGAVFVNRRSRRVEIAPLVVDQHAAGGLDDLLERVGHVLGHLPLVLADVVIDVQQRHAVSIDARRIDGDAVVRVRKRLTERMNLEPRRMAPLDLSLQRCAEPGDLIRSSCGPFQFDHVFQNCAPNPRR